MVIIVTIHEAAYETSRERNIGTRDRCQEHERFHCLAKWYFYILPNSSASNEINATCGSAQYVCSMNWSRSCGTFQLCASYKISDEGTSCAVFYLALFCTPTKKLASLKVITKCLFSVSIIESITCFYSAAINPSSRYKAKYIADPSTVP